jgi:hypothetical protein
MDKKKIKTPKIQVLVHFQNPLKESQNEAKSMTAHFLVLVQAFQ